MLGIGRSLIAAILAVATLGAAAEELPEKVRDFTDVKSRRFSERNADDGWRRANAVAARREFVFTVGDEEYRLSNDELMLQLDWRKRGEEKWSSNRVLPQEFNCRGFAAARLGDGRIVLAYRNAARESCLSKSIVAWVGPVEGLRYRDSSHPNGAFYARLWNSPDRETSARRIGADDSIEIAADDDGGVTIKCMGADFGESPFVSCWSLSREDLADTLTFWQRWRPFAEKWLKMFAALCDGLVVTLEIFFLTLFFSLPLGLLVAFGRMSRNSLLGNVVRIYISVVRGTPLMLQIIFVYYGPNYLFGWSLANYPLLMATVIAFSLNYAAYFAEIYRAGILSVDIGQYEAAYALGLGKSRTFASVIFPQVVKRVLPAITNEVITLVKDTSLAFTIALVEMFTVARQTAAAESTIMPLVAAGVFYYIFNYLVAFAMERLEKRFSYYN